MPSESSVTDLLTEGIAAARAGDDAEALRLLRRVLELDPDNVEAWVWRASASDNNADKKAYLEEALRLEPSNTEARLALERIIQREGELAEGVGDEPLFCTVHPDRETRLRCNRCGRPMCTDCAVRHPVGLRCRECIGETRSPIYKVGTGPLMLALLSSTMVSTVVGALVLLFGGAIWFFFWFFIGAAIGRFIAEVVQRAVPRKRGRAMQGAVAGGMLLGLLIAGAGIAMVLLGPAGLFTGLPAVLLQLHVLLYLGTALTSAVASLR